MYVKKLTVKIINYQKYNNSKMITLIMNLINYQKYHNNKMKQLIMNLIKYIYHNSNMKIRKRMFSMSMKKLKKIMNELNAKEEAMIEMMKVEMMKINNLVSSVIILIIAIYYID